MKMKGSRLKKRGKTKIAKSKEEDGLGEEEEIRSLPHQLTPYFRKQDKAACPTSYREEDH